MQFANHPLRHSGRKLRDGIGQGWLYTKFTPRTGGSQLSSQEESDGSGESDGSVGYRTSLACTRST